MIGICGAGHLSGHLPVIGLRGSSWLDVAGGKQKPERNGFEKKRSRTATYGWR